MQFTTKIMKFIIDIDNSGGMTKEKYGSLNYYFLIWYLRDNKLIKQNGFTNKNQKVWVLTAKGKKVANLLKELKVLMNGEGIGT